jgi:hypothetical protein
MLLTSEFMAFPQRVLLGIEIPKDPVTGQPITAAQLQAAQSRLWAFNSPPRARRRRSPSSRPPTSATTSTRASTSCAA